MSFSHACFCVHFTVTQVVPASYFGPVVSLPLLNKMTRLCSCQYVTEHTLFIYWYPPIECINNSNKIHTMNIALGTCCQLPAQARSMSAQITGFGYLCRSLRVMFSNSTAYASVDGEYVMEDSRGEYKMANMLESD